MLQHSVITFSTFVYPFMTEGFYLPLDAIIAPHFRKSTIMENPDTHNHGAISNKLNNIEVSVAEIRPELSTHEFERLTIRSPIPQPRHVTAIKHSHHPPAHEPQSLGVIECFPDVDKRHEFPRASSPTGSVRSSFGTRRHVSRASRWNSGFTYSHRSEVSRELTAQAEGEFFALMELMSGISRRSSSLKEVWAKIISERESCFLKMDQMNEQFEEYTESIERKEQEQQHHHHEHEDRKKEVSKLRLNITTALSTVSECKRKLAERDTELGNARREIAEFKDNFKYLKEEHEETKTVLDETRLKLVACDEARRTAEEDAKKHHSEIRSLKQQVTELQTSKSELTTNYESTHKEVVSLKQFSVAMKKEKHDWMHEKGELEENLRKCNHRNNELRCKVSEFTELNEKKVREVIELQEIISKTKYESNELSQKVTDLRRQLEEEHGRWEDAEDSCGKWKLKWEHCEREMTTIHDNFRLIELEQTELRKTITKKTEEVRRVVIEKERIEADHHNACKKADENHRQVLVLQESLRRTESTLKEKIELVRTLHERIERVESERDERRGKCSDLSIEISELQAGIVSLNLQIEVVTEERESIREKLSYCETRYEEVCESITEYEEGSSGSEYEITHLRAMLREEREQKEKAIDMRNSADRERDEAIVRYDEKCREIERLEESFSHQSHSHGRIGGRTTIRHLFKGSRSASTVHEEEQKDDQELC